MKKMNCQIRGLKIKKSSDKNVTLVRRLKDSFLTV